MDRVDESSDEEVDMTGDENGAERQKRTEQIFFLGLIHDMEEQ